MEVDCGAYECKNTVYIEEWNDNSSSRVFCSKECMESCLAKPNPAKHTPGPWRVTWAGNEKAGLYFLHEARRNSHPEVDDANARLIASAPELLMACEQLQLEIDGSIPKHRHEMPNTEGFCMMRAAIAKANGEGE